MDTTFFKGEISRKCYDIPLDWVGHCREPHLFSFLNYAFISKLWPKMWGTSIHGERNSSYQLRSNELQFPIKIYSFEMSDQSHRLVVLLFVNRCVKHFIIGKKDLSRVVIFVSLNGYRHNLKSIYFSQDCMKVGGFQLPWAAGVYIISFMLPWELTMPAALLPAARSISFFFAGQKLFAISKEIAKTLISELLYARNGNILQKRPATPLQISIWNKYFF